MPSTPPTIAAAIRSVQARVARVARPGGRWLSGYAKCKVAQDSIYTQLSQRIPAEARVLDLGAGVGLLGLVLEELHQGHVIHGLEWDERKVAFAQRLITPGSPCRVLQGDILTATWPPADVVVLVDVLHYFPAVAQQQLLQRIAQHLAPGGTLLLRVMDRDARGWARGTRLLEQAAVLFRWNRASQVHWRSLQEIRTDLLAFGLQSTSCQTDSHRLDGNCLIEASKT